MRALDANEPDHPAPYSKVILEALAEIVEQETERQGRRLRVLDPLAGVGRIHALDDLADTYSTELQHRWASAAPGPTATANARALPFPRRTFDLVMTSCVYGNRMSDTYDGSGDRCTASGCDGLGPCPVCGGTGLAASKRYTYTIAHGTPLHEDNAGALHWRAGRGGDAYRELHAAVWREAYRVLRPGSIEDPGRGGLLVVNVSNFYRQVGPKATRYQELQQVVEWHLDTLLRLGLVLVEARPVVTRRMRNGANRDARAEHEHILVLRRPDLPPDPQGSLFEAS